MNDFSYEETKVGVGISMARERSASKICEVFEALLAFSRRVRKRFMHRSREIPPVPSLHRPSTDGLIPALLVSNKFIHVSLYYSKFHSLA